MPASLVEAAFASLVVWIAEDGALTPVSESGAAADPDHCASGRHHQVLWRRKPSWRAEGNRRRGNSTNLRR